MVKPPAFLRPRAVPCARFARRAGRGSLNRRRLRPEGNRGTPIMPETVETVNP